MSPYHNVYLRDFERSPYIDWDANVTNAPTQSKYPGNSYGVSNHGEYTRKQMDRRKNRRKMQKVSRKKNRLK
jgi:hypothetical protein